MYHITRMNDDVGGGVQIIKVVNHAPQISESVFQHVRLWIYMAVGDLGYYHCINILAEYVRPKRFLLGRTMSIN